MPDSLKPYHIEIIPGSNPARSFGRKLDVNEALVVKGYIDDLLTQGVIAPSNSKWSSSIVLARKKGTDKLRVCLDLRELNKRMVISAEENFPNASIDAILQRCQGAHVMSSLDATSAFWMCPIDEESQHLTTFSTQFGCYRFLRLCMGLRNSPQYFAKIAAFLTLMPGEEEAGIEVSRGTPIAEHTAFQDDWTCITKTGGFEEHFEQLSKMLARLQYYGVVLQLKKCQFFRTSLILLGHKVSTDGVAPTPQYVRKVAELTNLKTAADLASWLGLIAYVNRYLHKAAERTKPIRDALQEAKRSGKEPVWTEECEAARLDLVESLQSAEHGPLILADMRKPFHLFIDGCLRPAGIGSILKQEDDSGELRIVGYHSKALQTSQLSWDSARVECYALLEGLRHWKTLIGNNNKKLTVYTDCRCLLYLRSQQRGDSPTTRFMLRVAAEIDSFGGFDVVHIPGVENGGADAMSRLVAADSTSAPRAKLGQTEKGPIADLWASCNLISQPVEDATRQMHERYLANPDLFPELQDWESLEKQEIFHKVRVNNILGPSILNHVMLVRATPDPLSGIALSQGSTWNVVTMAVINTPNPLEAKPLQPPSAADMLDSVAKLAEVNDAEDLTSAPTIKALQRLDQYCSPIMQYLELDKQEQRMAWENRLLPDGTRVPDAATTCNLDKEGVLRRYPPQFKGERGNRLSSADHDRGVIVVPEKLIPAIVRLYHADHPGRNAQMESMAQEFWWSTMGNDIQKHIS